jgi:serine/threonine protein kinase
MEVLFLTPLDAHLDLFVSLLKRRMNVEGGNPSMETHVYIGLLVQSGLFEVFLAHVGDNLSSVRAMKKPPSMNSAHWFFLQQLASIVHKTKCRREEGEALYRFRGIQSPYLAENRLWTYVGDTEAVFLNQLVVFLYAQNKEKYDGLLEERHNGPIPFSILEGLIALLPPVRGSRQYRIPLPESPAYCFEIDYQSPVIHYIEDAIGVEEEEEEDIITEYVAELVVDPVAEIKKAYLAYHIELGDVLFDAIDDNAFIAFLGAIALENEENVETLILLVKLYEAPILYQLYQHGVDIATINTEWLKEALKIKFSASNVLDANDMLYRRVTGAENASFYALLASITDTRLLKSIAEQYGSMMLYAVYKARSEVDVSKWFQDAYSINQAAQPPRNPKAKRVWSGTGNRVMERDIYVENEKALITGDSTVPPADFYFRTRVDKNETIVNAKNKAIITENEKNKALANPDPLYEYDYEVIPSSEFFKIYGYGYFLGSGSFGAVILYRFTSKNRNKTLYAVKFLENEGEMDPFGKPLASVMERDSLLFIQKIYHSHDSEAIGPHFYHHVGLRDYARSRFNPREDIFTKLRINQHDDPRLNQYCLKKDQRNMCGDDKTLRRMDMLVMEYAQNSTLDSFIVLNQTAGERFNMPLFVHTTIQVLGFTYALFKNGHLVHNDLKMENILIDAVTTESEANKNVTAPASYMLYNNHTSTPFILEMAGFICKVSDWGHARRRRHHSPNPQFDVEEFLLSYMQVLLGINASKVNGIAAITYFFENKAFLKFVLANIRPLLDIDDLYTSKDNPGSKEPHTPMALLAYTTLHGAIKYIIDASASSDLGAVFSDNVKKELRTKEFIPKKREDEPAPDQIINLCLTYVYQHSAAWRYIQPIPDNYKRAYHRLFDYIMLHYPDMVLNDAFRATYAPQDADMRLMNDYH